MEQTWYTYGTDMSHRYGTETWNRHGTETSTDFPYKTEPGLCAAVPQNCVTVGNPLLVISLAMRAAI